MKIAVIVTTYNRPDTLVKVLYGLMKQTRLPDEIIIADDGSGKETVDAVVPFIQNNQVRCVHVRQEDRGFRAARIRNKGIKACYSDYIVFLDGDCIPERHFVQDHLALAQKGFFFQGKRVIVSEKTTPGFSFKDTDSLYLLLKQFLTAGISNAHHIVRLPFLPAYTTSKLSGIRSCNMGFFKTDLLAVNGFNEAFEGWGREDSELVVRMYKYGIKRKEHPFRAICYHLWHQENSRKNMDKNDKILENAMKSDDYYCMLGIKNGR